MARFIEHKICCGLGNFCDPSGMLGMDECKFLHISTRNI
ncbi:hypothetical protein HU200_041806 [Digitaria exilis]|uniref:Uncharacterized protein n=1 Tax=Digitaria exilis TaxID=1010633 RepID=A0A835B673_9POAL|nr:hypothetical protein HU200_041806 [Digitaria exilis]